MLSQPNLSVRDNTEHIKNCLSILNHDNEAKKLLERFRGIMQTPGHHEEAVKTLYIRKLRAKQCLEIIYQGQTADRLCQQILNELQNKQRDLYNSLQISIKIQFKIPINFAGLVNDALNVFERCYGIPLPVTLPIRNCLQGEINSGINHTAELSFEQKNTVIQAISQTLSLGEQYRTLFSRHTHSNLTLFSTAYIGIDSSLPAFPPIILMARAIDKLKKDISQEAEGVVAAALNSPSIPWEAANGIFNYVFKTLSHFDHLFDEYNTILREPNPVCGPVGVVPDVGTNPGDIPAQNQQHIASHLELVSSASTQMIAHIPPATQQHQPISEASTERAEQTFMAEREPKAANVEIPKATTYADVVKKRPNLSERNMIDLSLYAQSFQDSYSSKQKQQNVPPAKFLLTRRRERLPLQPGEIRGTTNKSQRPLTKSSSMANFASHPQADPSTSSARREIREQPDRGQQRRSTTLTRSSSLAHLDPISSEGNKGRRGAKTRDQIKNALGKMGNWVRKRTGLGQAETASPSRSTANHFALIEEEEETAAATVVSSHEGSQGISSPNPATQKPKNQKKPKAKKPTRKKGAQEEFEDEDALLNRLIAENKKAELSGGAHNPQQTQGTIDLSREKKRIAELIKKADTFMLNHGHSGAKDIQGPLIPTLQQLKELREEIQIFTGTKSGVIVKNVPKAQEQALRRLAIQIPGFIDQYREKILCLLQFHNAKITQASLDDKPLSLLEASEAWKWLSKLLKKLYSAERRQLNKFIGIPDIKTYYRQLLGTLDAVEKKYFLSYHEEAPKEEDTIDKHMVHLQSRGLIFLYLAGMHASFSKRDKKAFDDLLNKIMNLGCWEIKMENRFLFLDSLVDKLIKSQQILDSQYRTEEGDKQEDSSNIGFTNTISTSEPLSFLPHYSSKNREEKTQKEETQKRERRKHKKT